jgi:hypothetical protein
MVVIEVQYKCGHQRRRRHGRAGGGGDVTVAAPKFNFVPDLTEKQDTGSKLPRELAVIELAQVWLNLPDYKRRYLFAMNFS